ncbi:hypothetical protein ERO13_D11G032801v2 [Gossypium hirsutum]|uniref:SHSP domain-containing protein n=1 Tax=Gossypium hirsutum TaxID=3635 RepID=A0A1U8JZJ9_GOSHI|nr:uncharacterized protein LOC107912148 [Gossypium hirsutum]KAG4118695.1 hypothetical protein ERO13_D11G032801v2 [Gossypium hirsutum]
MADSKGSWSQRWPSHTVERVFPSWGNWTLDSDGNYRLDIDLPGFAQHEVKIRPDSDGSIRLEAETIVDESKCKYIDQTIQLPENSDIVNLYGRFRGQVLTITVPKKVNADDQSSQEDDHEGEGEDEAEAEGEDEDERDDIKENRTKPEPENKKSDSDQDCRSLPKENIKKPPKGKESVLAIVMKWFERNKVIVVSNAISFSMGMWVSKLWT